MIYPGLVTLLALYLYIWLAFNVGRAHVRCNVKLPATSGNEEFERYNRVHLNTLEQMVLFLPALWMFAYFLTPLAPWTLVFGIGWVVGRVLYAIGYYKSTENRHLGFMISFVCTFALLLGATWGVVARFLIH